ncbi:unnamed protein product, partial [Iphiclides podalirius]
MQIHTADRTRNAQVLRVIKDAPHSCRVTVDAGKNGDTVNPPRVPGRHQREFRTNLFGRRTQIVPALFRRAHRRNSLMDNATWGARNDPWILNLRPALPKPISNAVTKPSKHYSIIISRKISTVNKGLPLRTPQRTRLPIHAH